MLSELDETIRQVLIKEGGFDTAEVEVSFDIPNREWSGGISKPTLNCYLFDIRENRKFREEGWQVEGRGNNGASKRQPPLFFDLTYLITAWTRAVEDEHRLLWHVMYTLTRFATLPAEHVQGALRDHPLPITTHLAQPDGVLKSPGEFWTALENHLKPSLSYVVTLAIDRQAIAVGPPVLTTRLRIKQGEADAEEWLWFGGVVRNADGVPQAGAHVSVENHAISAITDADGRFRFRRLPPGRYTLVAEAGGTTQRRTIELPEATYDLTLGTNTSAPSQARRRP